MSKKKRLNFKDDFELLYLRHEYIEKAQSLGKKTNPIWIKQYAGIVHTTAKIMFSRLKPNFQKVGFDEQDFIAITNIYMLSYMNLYSIQTNQAEMDSIILKKGRLSESEIIRIDRNRLIQFLRQRLHHCSTLFARKARNITVGEDKRGYFAETNESKGVSPDVLIKEYKKHGYRKLTLREFKEAQQSARSKGGVAMVDKDGFKVIKVEQLNQGLSEYDFQLLSEDDRGTFYNQPDVILQNTEDEAALEAFKTKFKNLDQSGKRQLLSVFVHRNYNDPALKQEIKWAEMVLKQKEISDACDVPLSSKKSKIKKNM